jgi:hypothetical protein
VAPHDAGVPGRRKRKRGIAAFSFETPAAPHVAAPAPADGQNWLPKVNWMRSS